MSGFAEPRTTCPSLSTSPASTGRFRSACGGQTTFARCLRGTRGRHAEPQTNAEAAAIGCSLATGLGCGGLMVFVGGRVLIAVFVLLVL